MCELYWTDTGFEPWPQYRHLRFPSVSINCDRHTMTHGIFQSNPRGCCDKLIINNTEYLWHGHTCGKNSKKVEVKVNTKILNTRVMRFSEGCQWRLKTHIHTYIHTHTHTHTKHIYIYSEHFGPECKQLLWTRSNKNKCGLPVIPHKIPKSFSPVKPQRIDSPTADRYKWNVGN